MADEAVSEPTPSTGKTDHRHFRDYPLTGHDADMPKSTRMTHIDHPPFPILSHRLAMIATPRKKQSIRENAMKTNYKLAIALIAGAAIGGAAIQGLHAQAKPPVYVVGENTVTNADAYAKEFVPLARASIKNAGGKAVAASQNVTSLEGAPQTSRVTINVFDSLEKAKAWRTGAEYTEARKIGDKYATFRAYVVEGLPQ
jgi:uncharacterized protein (DUF1330 family)